MYGKDHIITAQPKGVISLIALLVMFTIVAAAVGTSAVILNELRQTESITQSYFALYGAESGVEEGLYSVALGRSSNGSLACTKKSLQDSCDTACGCSTGSLTHNHSLANGAKWSRTLPDVLSFSVPVLAGDQSVSVDYTNPDDPTGASGLSRVTAVWNDDCGGSSQLETTASTYEVSGGTITLDTRSQQVYKLVTPCNSSSECSANIPSLLDADTQFVAFSTLQPYRFTLRPVNTTSADVICTLSNLTFTGYAQDDAVVPIPGHVTIKSVGSFGQSQQAVTASFPWRPPASGLLSFVLFSEFEITK